MNNRYIFALLISLLFSSALFSQTTIKGIVKDGDTGKPLENALVNFMDFYGIDIYTSTNKNGEFVFENIKSDVAQQNMADFGFSFNG